MLADTITINPIDYLGDELREDVHTIIDVLKTIITDDTLLDFVINTLEYLDTPLHKDGVEPMPFPYGEGKTEVIEKIIEDLFSLNALNNASVKQFMIDQLSSMIPGLEDVDVYDIDLEADGKLVAKAVTDILHAVRELGLFETVADFERVLDMVQNGEIMDLVDEVLESEQLTDALVHIIDAVFS